MRRGPHWMDGKRSRSDVPYTSSAEVQERSSLRLGDQCSCGRGAPPQSTGSGELRDMLPLAPGQKHSNSVLRRKFSFLGKNEIGFHCPSMRCSRTVPTAKLEASAVMHASGALTGFAWPVECLLALFIPCETVSCKCLMSNGAKISAQFGTKR